jgi:PST family polysaccharide transporter
MAVTTSMMPLIVRLRAKLSPQELATRTQPFFDAMAAGSYVVAVLMTFAARPLVLALFGPEFEGTVDVSRIHIWTFVFVCLGTARSCVLIADDLMTFSMVVTLLGGALNVALNLLLIPRYHGLGAAFATLAAQALSAYLSGWLDKRVWATTRQLSLALVVPLRPMKLWNAMRGR